MVFDDEEEEDSRADIEVKTEFTPALRESHLAVGVSAVTCIRFSDAGKRLVIGTKASWIGVYQQMGKLFSLQYTAAMSYGDVLCTAWSHNSSCRSCFCYFGGVLIYLLPVWNHRFGRGWSRYRYSGIFGC